MSLNPRITKDVSGTYWLEWDPDPSAEGYYFNTPGGSSRTFDNTKKKVKLGIIPEPVRASVAAVDVTLRAWENAEYPVIAPPPPPPPPPPPVGQDGVKLAAMFPALTQAVTKTGALSARWTPASNEKLKNWTATGWLSPDAHAMYINGKNNVAVEDGWCHDMTSGPSRPQVAAISGGSINTQIKRVKSNNIGYTSLDHAYYLERCDLVLIASCQISNTFEYPLHIYSSGGNKVSRVVFANCTIYGTRQNALAVIQTAADDILFVNCVFHGGSGGSADWAIRNKIGINLRAENCVWWNCNTFESQENASGNIVQKNVVKADPLFTNAASLDFTPKTGSPLINKGDVDWMPALDVNGNPFTRPTIGAVAV